MFENVGKGLLTYAIMCTFECLAHALLFYVQFLSLISLEIPHVTGPSKFNTGVCSEQYSQDELTIKLKAFALALVLYHLQWYILRIQLIVSTFQGL